MTESNLHEERLVPANRQEVTGNTVHGDQYIALRDNNVTNILSGLKRLRPRIVDPAQESPQELFVKPHKFDEAVGAVASPPAPGSVHREPASVLVLRAPDYYGRRTAALRILALHASAQGRTFELFPDWECPDVSSIPEEGNAGYLLNLHGVHDQLPESFLNELPDYAKRAREKGSLLVVIASSAVWPRSFGFESNSDIAVVDIGKPSAPQIAKGILSGRDDTRERASWLDDEFSIFSSLEVLPDDAPPADGVRLARVIARAEGPSDKAALDEYRDWQDRIKDWFEKSDETAPPARAIRIATAFFEGAPGSLVLDASDALLGYQEINWPKKYGGLLADPGVETRLSDAQVKFNAEDGSASFGDRPGMGPALLQYFWRSRGQLFPTLMKWLKDTTAAGAPAEGERQRLAKSLTTVAETAGLDPILSVVESWLETGKRQDHELAGDLLGELGADRSLGAPTRKKLVNWAKGKSSPAKQRAVARSCCGRFGQEFTREALTRLRYVLENTTDSQVRADVFVSLRELVSRPELSVQVVDQIVNWCEQPAPLGNVGATAFLQLFGLRGVGANRERALQNLDTWFNKEDANDQAASLRVVDGWRILFDQESGFVEEATAALIEWRRAAESDELPSIALTTTVEELLSVRSGPVNHPITRIIKEQGPLQENLTEMLINRAVQSVSTETPMPPREAVTNNGDGAPGDQLMADGA